MDFRKLAAIDIVFLGYKFVLAEYVCGLLLPIGLGVLSLSKHSIWMGAYLICLGLNYIPMLVYTISIANRERARAELGDELNNQRAAMSRYRRLSVVLLVPLAVPAVYLRQFRSFG